MKPRNGTIRSSLAVRETREKERCAAFLCCVRDESTPSASWRKHGNRHTRRRSQCQFVQVVSLIERANVRRCIRMAIDLCAENANVGAA